MASSRPRSPFAASVASRLVPATVFTLALLGAALAVEAWPQPPPSPLLLALEATAPVRWRVIADGQPVTVATNGRESICTVPAQATLIEATASGVPATGTPPGDAAGAAPAMAVRWSLRRGAGFREGVAWGNRLQLDTRHLWHEQDHD